MNNKNLPLNLKQKLRLDLEKINLSSSVKSIDSDCEISD